MPDIKTRDIAKGTIKTIDKSAVAAERMKSAFIQTKEKAEHSVDVPESSAEEYASNRLESGIDRVSHEAVHQFDKQGRKGVQATKQNIVKAKDGIQKFKEKRAAQSLQKQAQAAAPRKGVGQGIKAVEQPKKAVKESARSAGKKTIKTVGKGSAKTAQKTVKTAERTAKTTVKTAQRAAVITAKAIAKAIALAVKAIIAGTKALIAAIAAGGWIAVLVIIVICLIGMLLGSVFGIFFSGEDSGTGMSMQTVVQEINTEYDTKLQEEKSSVSYDVLEMSGSRAVWKEVLAVYSVKVNTDPDNPQEVATMDESKKQLLTDIFWEMNEISSSTDTKTETVITETDDGHGNIVETESTVTQTYLYITVSHKTADEMAAQYGFNEEQKEYLAELLADENNSLWSQVLYGIMGTDDQIVTVALSQIGNMGGEPYWSWYGFNSRVEWCACFVSWCANECGYIDAGVIPKYAGCVNGVQWFKDRGQWLDNSAEPAPGMIIFFDWADESGQDGLSDHTGIVQKVENGRVYTVEGNSSDSVRQNSYPVGYYEILGYGAPAY